jgi:hypothetical protein
VSRSGLVGLGQIRWLGVRRRRLLERHRCPRRHGVGRRGPWRAPAMRLRRARPPVVGFLERQQLLSARQPITHLPMARRPITRQPLARRPTTVAPTPPTIHPPP